MSIFSEIKKLLFGVKAVSKESIDKIKTETKDSSEHLLDVNEDFLKNRERSGMNKLSDPVTVESDQKKSVIEEIKESEVYKKTEETLEKIGDSILDTGEKFMEKSKEFIDGPGKKIADKFEEVSEKVGDKVMEGGKVLFDKASDLVSDLGEKIDETIQKAEKFASEEKEPKSEFSETEFKVRDSELADKEDFFNKADRFSKGDFSDFPKTTITAASDTEDVKTTKDITGFDDVDKDGDPLVDDANIIEESEDEKKL